MFSDDQKIAVFDEHRSRLFGIAYRMLGTRDDAEDILQEAYLRWHKSAADEINNPEAWLVTVVSRLSIDRLRKAVIERERYIGPWLPEPLVSELTPEDDAETAADLSLAFMFMLERLSPLERAVFLLHDIFDRGYDEISNIVGKSEAAARQIIHRARERVRSEKPRFKANEKERRRLIHQFVAASTAGDERTLLSIFSPDVRLTTDGGGKVNAARKVVRGSHRLARLFGLLTTRSGKTFEFVPIEINGEAGLLTLANGVPFAVNAFTIEDGKITALFNVMNPDKMKGLADALPVLAPRRATA